MHLSSELHNEGDGMGRSEKHSQIESSSLGEVHDCFSDVHYILTLFRAQYGYSKSCM